LATTLGIPVFYFFRKIFGKSLFQGKICENIWVETTRKSNIFMGHRKNRGNISDFNGDVLGNHGKSWEQDPISMESHVFSGKQEQNNGI
jgi:hypothetical protein